MEEQLKHLELIESYFEDQMSAEEKIDFEVRLLVDKELEEEFILYKKIIGGFQDMKINQLKNKMQSIDEELDNPTSKTSSNKNFYWWAGIAAVLLTVLVVIEKRSNKPIPLPIEEGLPIVMGNTENVEFQNAMQLYKAGEYEKSINHFNRLISTQPNNDTLNYFVGCAELSNKEFQNSINRFIIVSINNNSPFQLKAQYYLAFSYYKTKRFKEAKALITELITNKNNPFVEESKAFLILLNEH